MSYESPPDESENMSGQDQKAAAYFADAELAGVPHGRMYRYSLKLLGEAARRNFEPKPTLVHDSLDECRPVVPEAL
jgi:hypothetical protein